MPRRISITIPFPFPKPHVNPRSGQRYARLLVHKVLELLVRRLEVVVDDDDVVSAGSLGELELILGLAEALLDALLGLGAAAAEALLEGLLRRGRDEDVAGVDARGLDLLDALRCVLVSTRCILSWGAT